MEESSLQWYAVKVFYNKVFEMEAWLESQGYVTYMAVSKLLLKGEAYTQARRRIASLRADGRMDARYIEEGPILYQRIPMVSSLLFVRADDEGIRSIGKSFRDGTAKVAGFIYSSKDEDGNYFCAPIPERQMATFRLVTSRGSEGLDFFSADDMSRFSCGCKVRVTDGPLKGAEGYIKRIKRNRRLLVKIEGVIAVVTAFIDPAFLETVADEATAPSPGK